MNRLNKRLDAGVLLGMALVMLWISESSPSEELSAFANVMVVVSLVLFTIASLR